MGRCWSCPGPTVAPCGPNPVPAWYASAHAGAAESSALPGPPQAAVVLLSSVPPALVNPPCLLPPANLLKNGLQNIRFTLFSWINQLVFILDSTEHRTQQGTKMKQTKGKLDMIDVYIK